MTGPRGLRLGWHAHGGWFLGSRHDVAPYLELLASQGYAGAAPDYPLAPEHPYPAALWRLDRVLGELVARAADLGLDPDGEVCRQRIVCHLLGWHRLSVLVQLRMHVRPRQRQAEQLGLGGGRGLANLPHAAGQGGRTQCLHRGGVGAGREHASMHARIYIRIQGSRSDVLTDVAGQPPAPCAGRQRPDGAVASNTMCPVKPAPSTCTA